MKKILLGLLLCLFSFGAFAQGNPTCPTRPPGDSTNACASTAFVQNAVPANSPTVRVIPVSNHPGYYSAFGPFSGTPFCTTYPSPTSTTSCVQEAINYASTNGWNVAVSCGSNTAAGGEPNGVMGFSTTLVIPPMRLWRFTMESCTWDFEFLQADAITFDSLANSYVAFTNSQIVYRGTGAAIHLQPLNPAPQDPTYGIGVSTLIFHSIAVYGNGSVALRATPVVVGGNSAGINNNYIFAQELNGGITDAGNPVLIPQASPAVLGWPSFQVPLTIGEKVRFTSSGSLPSGITENQTYYVSAAGFSASAFKIADTHAHALAGTNSINTGSAGSGSFFLYTAIDTVALQVDNSAAINFGFSLNTIITTGIHSCGSTCVQVGETPQTSSGLIAGNTWNLGIQMTSNTGSPSISNGTGLFTFGYNDTYNLNIVNNGNTGTTGYVLETGANNNKIIIGSNDAATAYVDNSGATNVIIDQASNINAASFNAFPSGGYSLGNSLALYRFSTHYTAIATQSAIAAAFGDTTDQTNRFYNTSHEWWNAGNTAEFGSLNNAGLTLFTSASVHGLIVPPPSGTPTLTMPAVSGTFAVGASSPLALSATTGALTCPTCATTAGGGTISTLTFGTHLTSGGASYNGSAGVTITSDATSANTASTIVARDGSNNFSAGTITASLTGHASLDATLISPTVSNATVTGSFTATGLVTNADLANASTTVNSQTCTLGSTCTVTAAAGTLTGSTLAAGVTASSLTSVGTLTTGALGSGFTTVAVANGGTGDTGTAWPAFGSPPTLSCAVGTITSYTTQLGYGKTIGKTLFFTLNIKINNIGTCTGALTLVLNQYVNNATAVVVAHGQDQTTGATLSCAFPATVGFCPILAVAGTPFTATTDVIIFSGILWTT